MSLIAFHKFLISTAIVFCLGFAFRQLSEFRVTGDGRTLIVALSFAAAGVVLAFYLKHLRDILHLPSPRADLRPFIENQHGSFADRVIRSAEGHDEAADAKPLRSGNGHNKSKTPPVKENGQDR